MDMRLGACERDDPVPENAAQAVPVTVVRGLTSS
jgi:hypothetical protein